MLCVAVRLHPHTMRARSWLLLLKLPTWSLWLTKPTNWVKGEGSQGLASLLSQVVFLVISVAIISIMPSVWPLLVVELTKEKKTLKSSPLLSKIATVNRKEKPMQMMMKWRKRSSTQSSHRLMAAKLGGHEGKLVLGATFVTMNCLTFCKFIVCRGCQWKLAIELRVRAEGALRAPAKSATMGSTNRSDGRVNETTLDRGYNLEDGEEK